MPFGISLQPDRVEETVRAKQWMWIALALAAVVLIIGGISTARRAWMIDAERAQAVAMQMCSCVFVSGRQQNDCSSDFPLDHLTGLELEIINGAARVHGAGHDVEARYSATHGCQLAETR